MADEPGAASDLGHRFDGEMMSIYLRAKKECHYNATRFLQMLEQGGVTAAKQILNAPNTSDGFSALWELRRLDLTVEALVLRDPWQQLFTADELSTARQRLDDLGYSDACLWKRFLSGWQLAAF